MLVPQWFARRRTVIPQLWLCCLVGLLLAVSYDRASLAATPAQPVIPSADHPALTQGGGPWTNFSTFDGPAADSLLCLHQDPNGYLWVGTERGVSVRSPAGEWQTLTVADGLAGSRVTAILTDPTNVHWHWLATDGGASLLDDGGDPLAKTKHRWATFSQREGLLDNRLSSVTVAANGDIWFGLTYVDSNNNEIGQGISVLNPHGTLFDKTDDAWSNFTVANSSLASNAIHRMATDAQGVIWIATQSGLNAYQNGEWTLFSTEQGLPSNKITAFVVDGATVWIGTSSGFGVLDDHGTVADRTDDQWRTFSYNGATIDDVSSLALDAAGRLWVGVDYYTVTEVSSYEGGRGLVIDLHGTPLDPSDDSWLIFDVYGQVSVIRALLVSDHTTWFATDTGLRRLNYNASPFDTSQQWSTENSSNLLVAPTISAVVPYTADLMLLNVDGVAYLFDDGLTPHNLRDDRLYDLGLSSTRAVAVDQQKRIWNGASAGLTVLDVGASLTSSEDDQSITYDHTSGLLADSVNKIAIDAKGRAWLANGDYLDGGLNVLAIGNSVAAKSDDQWATFTPQNSGLPARYVTALAVGKGNDVWVGTNNGLGHLQYGASPFDKGDDSWTTFTTQNSGLANNFIRAIAIDPTGNVWIALAAGGVSVYTTDGAWVTFTEADGLALASVNTLVFDPAGQVWLGTDGEGISVLNTAHTVQDKHDDSWTTYRPGQPLLSGYIQALALDPLGQIWIGTFGGGLSLYSTLAQNQSYLPLIANGAVAVIAVPVPFDAVK